MSGTPRYRVIVAAKLLLVGRPFATVCDTHGRCFSIRSMAMSALTCYFARPRMRGRHALHAELKDVRCMQCMSC